jgi:hypothetical protein
MYGVFEHNSIILNIILAWLKALKIPISLKHFFVFCWVNTKQTIRIYTIEHILSKQPIRIYTYCGNQYDLPNSMRSNHSMNFDNLISKFDTDLSSVRLSHVEFMGMQHLHFAFPWIFA